MLHTLSHSPFQTDLTAVLRNVIPGDAILLLQDGVLAAIDGTDACCRLLEKQVPLFVLLPDLVARGLSSAIASSFTPISYTDFVDLTVEHSQQMNW